MSQLLEAAMIISFGFSWPMNIIKSVKSKTAKGRSFLFLYFVLFGYICGILSKIVLGTITYVLIFYIINFLMVFADLILCLNNRKNDKLQ